MRTVRRFALLSLGSTAVLLAACDESISAPGACPEFCPSSEIQVLDTVLIASVERDSSFVGYVQTHEAAGLQVASGGAVEARGVLRFLTFGPNSTYGTGVNQSGPVARIDSFQIHLLVRSRHETTQNLDVRLYRLPAGVDSTTSFDDVDPFFDDSLLVGSAIARDLVADTSLTDSIFTDTLTVSLPGDAFADRADTTAAVVGIAVQGEVPTWISLGTLNSASPGSIVRFTQVDTSDTDTDTLLVAGEDTRGASFDNFVRTPGPPLPGASLVVGGTPSARTLVRLVLPPVVIDSAAIVGATLLLVPTQPAIGAPLDTFLLQAAGLAADFGPKSPLRNDVVGPGARVVSGQTDTVAVDLTPILLAWQADSTAPRSIMLRLSPEAASLGELHFGSSSNPAASPVVRLTFVSPFRFEGQ